MGDVLLTGTAIALFAAILAPVVGCVSLLFKLVMAEKDRSYERLERESDARDEDRLREIKWLQDQVALLQSTQGPMLEAIYEAVKGNDGRWRVR